MNDIVSEPAVVARIRRRLAHDWKTIRKARARDRSNLDGYYVVDLHYNAVVDYQIDLTSYARDLGCLHDDEVVAETEGG